MIPVLYIGNDREYIARFTKYWENMVVVGSIEHAKAFVNQQIVVKTIMLESVDTISDINTITLLKADFPQSYIILIREKKVTKEDASKYLHAGVALVFSPNVSEKVIKRNIDYLNKKEQLSKTEKTKGHKVTVFHMPLGKRLFDIVASSFALLVLSPIFLVVAILIRMESKGPIIYKSKRVGSNFKTFDFLKFRSMYPDADKRLKEYLTLNQYAQREQTSQSAKPKEVEANTITKSQLENDAIWVGDDSVMPEDEYIQMRHSSQENAFVKYKNDPRITKVGRFIRKYSIDELPQIINILKGDMSVVGNRPLPLYEAELLTTDNYIDRFIAPAGLTGLWQVEKRGGSAVMSAEERKELDIYYAKHCSFWFDMKIIFKTFFSFIQKEDV